MPPHEFHDDSARAAVARQAVRSRRGRAYTAGPVNVNEEGGVDGGEVEVPPDVHGRCPPGRRPSGQPRAVGVVPLLRASDLWKEYGDGRAGAALRGVSLAVEAGSVVALYGKSGSGKTTLLNLLAGLDRPSRGRIEVDGQDLSALGERGRTLLRRRRLGFVFQFFNLLPTLTAFENVFLSLELAGRPDPAGAREALASLGLGGKEGRYPHELSGGEQ
ncbi:MAG: ATP-binding cassette domain-containing protein, partial [Deltaproteobacteria bacterium]|nr:ATP-binding cassette domain-containing protein [Deltaproteobacteria bacterium]